MGWSRSWGLLAEKAAPHGSMFKPYIHIHIHIYIYIYIYLFIYLFIYVFIYIVYLFIHLNYYNICFNPIHGLCIGIFFGPKCQRLEAAKHRILAVTVLHNSIRTVCYARSGRTLRTLASTIHFSMSSRLQVIITSRMLLNCWPAE